MQAFGVLNELTVRTNQFVRHYESIPATDAVDVGKLIISVPGELKGVTDSIDKAEEGLSVEEKQLRKNKQIVLVSEEALFNWQSMPMRLGRISLGFVGNSKHHHLEDEPLRLQLSELKRRKIEKNVFRIAIVNSFGTNLGDNLVGQAALSCVAKMAEACLGKVSFDILCGPGTSKHIGQIFKYDDFVENTTWLGPALSEFGDYDGYFDFSGIINEPRFTELTPVDWCIWWMGLNPGKFEPHEKRCRRPFDIKSWTDVRGILPKTNLKKVFFEFSASVALRTFPENARAKFVETFLRVAGDAEIISLRSVGIKHPRLHDYSNRKLSTAEYEALIAQCDALVTVDTYAMHVADACSLPTVMLSASMPADRFSHYPTVDVIELPNVANLPAYKQSKVDDKKWLEYSPIYENAWRQISAKQVWHRLLQRINTVAINGKKFASIRFGDSNSCGNKSLPKNVVLYQEWLVRNKWAGWLAERLPKLAIQLSRYNSTIISAGGVLKYDEMNAGEQHKWRIFEPRQSVADVASYLLARCGNIFNMERCLPYTVNAASQFPKLRMSFDFDLYAWGNSHHKHHVVSKTASDWLHDCCDVLIVQPPFSAAGLLKDNMAYMAAHEIIIVIGGISKQEISTLGAHVDKNLYDLWAEKVPHGVDDKYVVLGVPHSRQVSMAGFSKVVFA